MATTPPYRFEVSFTAAGSVAQTGPGQLSEIRMPGKRRWTAALDGFSVIRWTTNGLTVEDQHAPAIPMRVEALRDAIHWAGAQLPIGSLARSAAVEWNGRPPTCLLFSNWSGPATLTQGRLWEENEYCLDDASGLLQVQSIAPGTYTVYDYGRNLQFHGHPVADHISIYTGGVMVADAQFTIADMSAADQDLLTPEPGAAASGPIVALQPRERTPLNTSNPFPAKTIEPVMVEAELDGKGEVVEEELCAAADPALAQPALDLVKKTRFRHRAGTQYQLFVNVKFRPSGK